MRRKWMPGNSLGRGGGEAVNQVALYSLTLWYGLKSKLTYRLSSVFELLGKFLEIFAHDVIYKGWITPPKITS